MFGPSIRVQMKDQWGPTEIKFSKKQILEVNVYGVKLSPKSYFRWLYGSRLSSALDPCLVHQSKFKWKVNGTQLKSNFQTNKFWKLMNAGSTVIHE